MFKSFSSKVYTAIAAVLLLGYVYVESRGVVFAGTDERGAIPPGARGAPGGYRGGGIWFYGTHGGK